MELSEESKQLVNDFKVVAHEHGVRIEYVLETPRAGELVISDIAAAIEPDDEGWPLSRFAIIFSELPVDERHSFQTGRRVGFNKGLYDREVPGDFLTFELKNCEMPGFLHELRDRDGFEIIYKRKGNEGIE